MIFPISNSVDKGSKFECAHAFFRVIIIVYIQLHSAFQAFCDVLTFAIHTYLLELLESNRIVHGWLRRRRRPRSGSWFRWFSNCNNHEECLLERAIAISFI